MHFNYINAAPYGAAYRKEREKDIQGTGKIGACRGRDEQDGEITDEGRQMQENGGMGRKPFEDSSASTAEGRKYGRSSTLPETFHSQNQHTN